MTSPRSLASSRPLAAFVALVVLVIALPGCTKKGTATGTGGSAVVFALDWVPEPEFGGFYAARESGGFKRHGLDVEIRGGGAGVPVVQMVASGKVQFGIAGADEVITARKRGADVVPIFATFQTSPQAIMVHASRGYKSLGDALKAGTLAIEPGLPYAAFLKKKYGGFGATIVPYDGGVARFMVDTSFAQQCFVTAEPLAARKKGADPQVFMVSDEGFNPYTGVVIVKKSLLAEHPDWVKGFVLAAREGWTSYLAEPGPTNAVMQKLNPSMDAETFAAAAAAEKPLTESADTKAHGLGSMTRERWETLGKQLVDIGIVDSAPPVDEYLAPLP
jgi:NitT/TauT family transport system substrate-binding protein